MQPDTEHSAISSDALTTSCIAIIAYVLASVLHGGLGHAGACVVSGGKPIMVSTVAMECSADNRLVVAGGTLVNVAAGALFFVFGRMTSRISSLLKYFLWLSMTVNLFTADRLHPWDYDHAIYKKRNEIERLFRRLKGFRRIFSRFEKLDVLFLGFVSFALVVEALRVV
jgi:hypothetical protein